MSALTVCTLVGAGTIAPSAHAGSPTNAEQAEAKKKTAFRLFAEGDFAGGISAMRESHALVPHPGALFNIAVGYDQWGGHCQQAVDAFAQFFALCAGSCEQLGVAARRHEKVEAQCKASVTLESTPAGALLQLDGEGIGPSPVERKLLVGSHELVATRPGYQPKTISFAVEAGKSIRIVVELQADVPTATIPPPAPDATLYESPRAGGSLRPWSYVAFGVGGAGAIMGVIFTIKTLSDLDDEDAARATPLPKQDILDLQGTARTDAALANVGFGLALLGAASGVALFLLSDEPESEPSVTPVVGPGAVGLTGRF